MPIYEYQCQQCGQLTEFIQKVDEAPKSVCPNCGAAALQKCLSRTSFQLKGSGWYVTDFRDQSKKSPSGAGTETSSPNTDKSTKSE